MNQMWILTRKRCQLSVDILCDHLPDLWSFELKIAALIDYFCFTERSQLRTNFAFSF